jgi:Xaa-Pro aminopeptidase
MSIPTATPALGPREQALWDAQKRAEALFAEVIEQGILRPGPLESEVSAEIHELARRSYGVQRHWHKKVVRSGPNTVLTYYDEPPDRRLAPDDMVFLDFGPVFDNWEADLGRSYVLGPDPRKHQLVKDIGQAFDLGRAHYESEPDLTAGELYDYVVRLGKNAGWEFGASTAGHPVDEFPHERDPTKQYSIRHGNSVRLRDPLPDGTPRHWILEIHFVDRQQGYGGFFEELLTIRGAR